jgi:MoaA/NifB/PqqE/SkfB family radical SAM enzyme
MGLRSAIQNLKSKIYNQRQSASDTPNIPRPGLYHYLREDQGERSRIHLRIDPCSGDMGPYGILLVNANRVLHLNQTATLMAYLTLEQVSEDRAVRVITRQYNISPSQSREDFAKYKSDLDELLHPGDACPVCDLDVEVTAPFAARPTAPYRMDLALTYRCNNDCAHCYNARSRDYPEISTDQWKRILDRLWEISIPHVVFTGGDPTLREDLPDLISHAERNGQITGLNTNARRLSNRNFVNKLVEAGLDHVQITVESHDPEIHDAMVRAKGAWKQTITGLHNVLDTPLYVMTNTTMLSGNSPYLGVTLDFLASAGVPTIGLNALIYSGRGLSVGTGLSESELFPLLNLARDKTDYNNQRLIWYTPTQYCNFDPMELELGVKGCTAALYNMCVEPDGGVIPCQSYYHQLMYPISALTAFF